MQIIKLPLNGGQYTQGDTFPEVLFQFSTDDAIDLTGSNIKLEIYSSTHNKIKGFSENGGISIIDSKSFKIDAIDKEETKCFPNGILKGDLEITDPEGVRLTYLEIHFNIRKQFTR